MQARVRGRYVFKYFDVSFLVSLYFGMEGFTFYIPRDVCSVKISRKLRNNTMEKAYFFPLVN